MQATGSGCPRRDKIPRMRILVTGCEGQVAQALTGLSVADMVIMAIGRPDLDITDPTSVRKALEGFGPDIVVNAAAYTAVDRAETEPETAFSVNRDGARHVALASADAGVPVIHISTDYVFSGDKTGAYHESDETGPASVYGQSKLGGEQAVAAANPAHVILRTAWVYSAFGSNFLKTMLRLAADRDTVRVVADQHGSPTYASDIASGILAVARRIRAEPRGSEWRGVFHMTAAGQTTWAGFAEAIFAKSATLGGPSAHVEPITTADYPTPAKRPANSALSNDRFATVFGHSLPPWRISVDAALEAILLK